MPSRPLHTLMQYLRRTAGPRDGASLSDAELLERFLAGRDEAAFELLVWRYGPLVLGVCHRLLRGAGDIEDSFQASFLVTAGDAHRL